MRRSLALIAAIAVVAGLATQAVAKPADKSTIRKLLPADVFGTKFDDVKCTKDKKGDFTAFNGKKPGRHDAFVDIKRACIAYVDEKNSDIIDRLETNLPCGPKDGGQVICSPSKPPLSSTGNVGLTIGVMQTRGDIPIDKITGMTGRFSFFVHAAGNDDTLIPPSADAVHLSSVESNLLYTLLYGTPGVTTLTLPVELLVDDRRKTNEFITNSHARIYVTGDEIIFVLPEDETGKIIAIRFAAYWADEENPGDTDLLDEDTAPNTPKQLTWMSDQD